MDHTTMSKMIQIQEWDDRSGVDLWTIIAMTKMTWILCEPVAFLYHCVALSHGGLDAQSLMHP